MIYICAERTQHRQRAGRTLKRQVLLCSSQKGQVEGTVWSGGAMTVNLQVSSLYGRRPWPFMVSAFRVIAGLDI